MSAIEEEVLGIGKKLEKLVEQGQAVCNRENIKGEVFHVCLEFHLS